MDLLEAEVQWHRRERMRLTALRTEVGWKIQQNADKDKLVRSQLDAKREKRRVLELCIKIRKRKKEEEPFLEPMLMLEDQIFHLKLKLKSIQSQNKKLNLQDQDFEIKIMEEGKAESELLQLITMLNLKVI